LIITSLALVAFDVQGGDVRLRDDTLNHVTACGVYPDTGDAFVQGLRKAAHLSGQAPTQVLDRDHSHTRQHLARMTPRTTVVSKSETMIHASLKLWWALTVPATFVRNQASFWSIFR
jgi:hypothetical protein